MREFIKDRRLWLAVIIVIVAVIAVRYTAGGVAFLNPAGTAISEVLRPFQLAVARVSATVSRGTSYIASIKETKERNAALEKEVLSLRKLENQVEELRQENERLRALLQFGQSHTIEGSGQSKAAWVIARNPDTWFSSIIISRGSKDGIREGAVVVTSQGLVGRVTKVAPHSANVMLITDPQSGVGAIIQRQSSRAMGVATGKGNVDGFLRMKFFNRDADVRREDKVVTSSLGQVFPKGLPIGTVESVKTEDNGLVKTAYIRPAVDFNTIEEVLVLLPANPGSVSPDSGGTRGNE